MKMFAVGLLLLFTLASCATEIGRGGPESVDVVDRWESLGSKRVSLAEPSSEIDLSGARGEFKELKIICDEPITVTDVRVTFANEQVWSSSKKLTFTDRVSERVLTLPEDNRMVTSLRLTYSSDDLGDGRASFKVFGR